MSRRTDEQIVKILEIACRIPEEFGYEVSHWSLNILAKAVVEEGIVDSISAKRVSDFFKNPDLHTSQKIRNLSQIVLDI